jgi:hypothetical protein
VPLLDAVSGVPAPFFTFTVKSNEPLVPLKAKVVPSTAEVTVTVISADVIVIPVASKPVNEFISVASHALIVASSFASVCSTVYDPSSIKTFAVAIALLSGVVL